MQPESFSNLYNDRTVRVCVATVLGVLALFLLAQTVSVVHALSEPGNPATDVVTVTGDGQSTMAPDVARVSFTVTNSESTVSAAQDDTTKQANAVIAYVKSQNVADKDVKTLSYNISPRYNYPQCPNGGCPSSAPTITGYDVSETVQVTIRDLANVGTIIGGLGKMQVQNLNGPSFALDDPTAGYDAARADAITKAKAQAAELASQLGVHLGKIVSFNESSGGGVAPVMFRALDSATAAGSAAVSPSVPTGENTYNASVSITYEIR